MARATSSLPVPLSPVISTGVRVSFKRATNRSTSWIFVDEPTMALSCISVLTCSRSVWFSITRRTFSAVRCSASFSSSTRKGLEELKLALQRTAEKVRLVMENQTLREHVSTEMQLNAMVGSSSKIQDVLRLVARLKDTRTPVLITGESGTGKELVARAIHFRGALASRPFVAVDCGSLVPTLIESELFG